MKTKEQILNYVQGTKQLLQEHNLLGEAYEDGWVVDFIEDIRDWIENRPKYFIGSDDSGHEYLVDASHEKDWYKWRDIPEEDERSWDQPSYAEIIEGERMYFYLE